MPLWGFGCIQHGPFIVTFGGVIRHNGGVISDDIYILDLRKNCGWIQSPMKCPRKGDCTAAVDDCGSVHLWHSDSDPDSETHHCIQLSTILPSSMW